MLSLIHCLLLLYGLEAMYLICNYNKTTYLINHAKLLYCRRAYRLRSPEEIAIGSSHDLRVTWNLSMKTGPYININILYNIFSREHNSA